VDPAHISTVLICAAERISDSHATPYASGFTWDFLYLPSCPPDQQVSVELLRHPLKRRPFKGERGQ
jgi:hypothetical protein